MKRTLNDLIKLQERIAIYVPSTHNIDGVAHHIDNTPYVQDIAAKLSNMCGGASSYNANGYWQSPTRGLEIENVTIVYANCENASNYETEVIAMCENLKSELGQDAISLEINNALYLV